MLDKIRAAITALNHGEKLTHVETWKHRQNLLNALVAVIGAVAVFLPESIGLTDADVAAIAGGIAAVAGLLNNYLTTATTDKIGLQSGGSGDEDRQNFNLP